MKKADDLREISELTDEDLKARSKELGQELLKLRFRKASGQLEQTHLVGETKRKLAQVKTVITARQAQAAA